MPRRHARLGTKARWYCSGCNRQPDAQRVPCPDCCGWTPTTQPVPLTKRGTPHRRLKGNQQ